MRVLVTGADGFVGRYLVRRLLADGHTVSGAVRPGSRAAEGWLTDAERSAVRWTDLELNDPGSARSLAEWPADGIVHLAAMASSRDARKDPGAAWNTNAAGTARLVEALASARAAGTADPLVLIVSSGEVYGAAESARAFVETDALRPQAPYAASKVGAEFAALETWRRTGLRVVIARPFQHTGPGQTDTYVLPALALRLLTARAEGAATVRTGNLEPVRDVSDVRDIVAAYLALLVQGKPGEAYNVSRGEGVRLGDLFERLRGLTGAKAVAEPDPALMRAADIPYLVGDSTKLRTATGWAPTISLDQTLRDMVDAQTN